MHYHFINFNSIILFSVSQIAGLNVSMSLLSLPGLVMSRSELADGYGEMLAVAYTGDY